MIELPTSLPWKIPPWIKWILKSLLVIPLAIPLLIVASLVFSALADRATHARWDGVYYSTMLKQTEREFRRSFHDRSDYPALTLSEMETKGLLSETSAGFFARYPHEFVPFTPQTPDSTIVLTIHGLRPEPDRFTKRDLTADPADPEHPSDPLPASPSPSSVP